MVADLNSAPVVKVKTHAIELREKVHADALMLGVRASARKWNVPEQTALTWSRRENWQLPACLATLRQSRHHHKDVSKPDETRLRTLNALSESIDEHGEHSRLYLSAATLQAAHDLAAQGGKTQGERVPYSGLLNTSRSGDVVHGWSAARQQMPNTNVAVQVVLPTPEQDAARREIDRRLDILMARLNSASRPAIPEPAEGRRGDQ